MDFPFKRQWPELPLRCGAVPFRSESPGRLEMLLVRRPEHVFWSIPKGQTSVGRSWVETAANEVFEEAGVCGQIHDRPLGSYLHRKGRGYMFERPRIVEVIVFPYSVEAELDRWPEMESRQRQWFLAEEVANSLAQPELGNILASLCKAEAVREIEATSPN